MIYGLKYFGEFKDYFNNSIRVEIAERNYSGSSFEMVMAENPLQLDYPGDEFDVYRPIYGSQLVISVISTINFQYISLHTADARQYQVTVLKNGILFWKGWVIPDLFNEPYVAPPYIVNISARCGLGELENIPVPDTVVSYVDGSSTPTPKSFVNLYSIITHSLRLLNLGLNIKEAINIYNAERTTAPINTDSSLTDTYIELTQYSGKTLYELLSDILRVHTARLYQQDGYWWIVRLKELNDTLRYRILDVNGGSVIGFDDTKLTTFLIGKVHNNHIVNNGPELRINPAWKEFDIISRKEVKSGLLQNNDFRDYEIKTKWERVPPLDLLFETPYPSPTKWQSTDPATVLSGGGVQMIPNGNIWSVRIFQNFTLEKTNFQALKISFECYPQVGPENQSIVSFAIMLKCTDGDTTKYAALPVSPVVELSEPLIWVNDINQIVIPNVQANGAYQVNGNKYEFYILGLPVTGDYEFSIYSAKKAYLIVLNADIKIQNVIYRIIDPVNLVIGNPFFIDYESEITQKVIVNPNNNYIPSPVEVYGGDLPDVPNANKIWKFGYSEVNGTRTRIWNNFGETNELPLLQHLANDYKKMYLLPQWVLSLPILSENIKFDSSIVDYQVIGKKYRCVSASFNLRDSICEGIFAEVGAWEGDGTGDQWILKTGYWNDNGIWIDTEVWQEPI